MRESNTDVYEERAENLSEKELTDWTVLSDVEKQIIKKLTGHGAKLISGPRGSGKSTLLKIAFFRLLNSKKALPVYVNFSKALALEPLFHTSANAPQIFRQWVLSKILNGLKESCARLELELPVEIELAVVQASSYIDQLESGRRDLAELDLSPSGTATMLGKAARLFSANRAVLLLDDAAHAFSVKQQREFFEVFRELKSSEISAKAAIYPGVTSFSPSFQIGHEAEEIQAWIRVDQPSYLVAMHQICEKRFPDLRVTLGDNYEDAINALALASFGLPRGFVNMVSEVTDLVELSIPIKKAVLDAISSNAESAMIQFTNIADKLPRFANYIDTGNVLEAKVRKALHEYNRGKDISKKSATFGLAQPWDPELDRVLRFMEYAGLFRRIESLSKGEKGSYQRYYVHYSRLISTNTLFLGKNYKLSRIYESLRKPLAHALVKTRPDTLLGHNYSESCTLALPPCPRCDTARMSEQQKFCMNCGMELRSASIYLELLKASVDKLPITRRKVDELRKAGLETVGQLLSDEKQSFRKRGSSIGKVWTKRILNVAEEFVSV